MSLIVWLYKPVRIHPDTPSTLEGDSARNGIGSPHRKSMYLSLNNQRDSFGKLSSTTYSFMPYRGR